MQRGQYVIDWKTWTQDSSKSDETRRQRANLLKGWAKANGRGVDVLLSDILSDRVTVYESASRFLNTLREQKRKPSTVSVYRTLLPNFFRATLGAQNFDEQAYDLLCPSGDDYVSTTKRVPTLDHVRSMIQIASPRNRALIGLLLSGMRPLEACSRTMSDFAIRDQGYGVIRLLPKSTKKRRKRFCFISTEAVSWIQSYRTLRRSSSNWILPGENGQHLSYESVYVICCRLFEKIGLKNSEDGTEIWSPHSFRSTAGSIMRSSGLNETWVSAIVGQVGSLGAKANYLPWNDIEKDWFEKCHDNFLMNRSSPSSIEQRIRDLERQIQELKTNRQS